MRNKLNIRVSLKDRARLQMISEEYEQSLSGAIRFAIWYTCNGVGLIDRSKPYEVTMKKPKRKRQ